MENENERKQVDWLEKRLSERDAKIDVLYNEFRREQILTSGNDQKRNNPRDTRCQYDSDKSGFLNRSGIFVGRTESDPGRSGGCKKADDISTNQ